MRSALALVALLAAPGLALAHDGVVHATPEDAARHNKETAAPLPAPSGLPFDLDLGGPYELVSNTGETRDQTDPVGNMQMVFFGYANCPSICAVALPLMGEVTAALDEQGIAVTPVMITVDPERDTTENMGPALAKFHDTFVGLTGTEDALQVAYDAFKVEKEVVFEDPEFGEIFAHGSHIYLLDGAGEFLTLLPPILAADRIAEIAAAYASGS
jgi:protein SCO1/2